MANSFGLSFRPELAAVKTVVDANSVILVDVHNTDLPAVKTDIGSNTTAIGNVKSVVDAVKLKTDLLPLTLPKCKPYQVTGSGTSASYVELINVTGAGIFYYAYLRCTDNTTGVDIKITIDGLVEEFIGLQTLDYIQILREAAYDSDSLFLMWDTSDPEPPNLSNELNVEFSTDLKVEYRRSAGAMTIYWHLVYGVV